VAHISPTHAWRFSAVGLLIAVAGLALLAYAFLSIVPSV
jgi:hypothetical protein